MNKLILIIVITLLIGLGAGFGVSFFWLSETGLKQEKAEAVKKPLFYRNPMNPDVTSPVPTKDPMGMDYVPVYAEADKPKEKMGTVTIDPVVEQNIGVRTANVIRQDLTRNVRAVGRIDYNEEHMVHLHPKTEGWIESLKIDKTGQKVEKNARLLSIYSPQLVTSQQEYILALNNLKILKNSPIDEIRQGAEDLVNSAKQRLKLLDVPSHQLYQLEHSQKIKKSLHIHSPEAGIVMKIGAREGQYVTPATEIYMIADLSTVWVYADIYEYELPWVKKGDLVEMQLAGIPGRTFKGKLTYIYPYADAKTRTIKVRLAFNNPNLLLKPNMFAELSIKADKRLDTLVIPAESVIRSGTRNQVFVVRGKGKFEPRLVTLGLSSGDKIEVLKGLAFGEEVVTSAQFLIDSESKLREATAKMLDINYEEPKKDIKIMNHEEHDMSSMKNMESMKDMDDMKGMNHEDHDMSSMNNN